MRFALASALCHPTFSTSDMLHLKISLQTASCRYSSPNWPRARGKLASTGIHHQASIVSRHRSISTYGYIQAKSLVYPKHGNPTEVLRYVDAPVCA